MREAGIPLVNAAPERLAAPVTTSNSGKAQKAAAAQSLYFEFAPLIIREYSQVVLHGSKRVQHALPRFLTLLIEFGHDVHLLSQHKQPQQSTAASQFMLNRLITSVGQHAELVRSLQPVCVRVATAFERRSFGGAQGTLAPLYLMMECRDHTLTHPHKHAVSITTCRCTRTLRSGRRRYQPANYSHACRKRFPAWHIQTRPQSSKSRTSWQQSRVSTLAAACGSCRRSSLQIMQPGGPQLMQ